MSDEKPTTTPDEPLTASDEMVCGDEVICGEDDEPDIVLGDDLTAGDLRVKTDEE